MRAVVLIGGKGTRLQFLTRTVPKLKVTLRNKPYVQYTVYALRAAGLDGAVLSMGYLPCPIQQHFAEQNLDGFSLEYVVEEGSVLDQGARMNPRVRLPMGVVNF